ncbi:hypothetical protein AAHE18_04G008000 [Arachis hypogaea]
MEENNVVVIQDASKELHTRVFSWAIDSGLALKAADKVTLVSIMHQIHTPMGYYCSVHGLNRRIVAEVASRKMEEYLQNDELAQIAKLYESNEVAFKIQLVTGSPLKELALKAAINLKATWLILDRQLKKDAEFFQQKLSCGISRLKRNNRIVHLRAPTDIPTEIQCSSHETFDQSLPEPAFEDLFLTVDDFNKSNAEINVDESSLSRIQGRCQRRKATNTLLVTNRGEREINNDEETGEIEREKQREDDEQIKSMLHEEEMDTTVVTNNDEITAHDIAQQPSRDKEQTQNLLHVEAWSLRHPSNIYEMNEIDQPSDKESASEELLCSICKIRRPNIEWKKEFTYEELQIATDGFSLKNCLSEGGYLSTFKGQLEGELKIVVKQHELRSSQEREKIQSEVRSTLKVRHKNVVMLLGLTTEASFLLTVSEYACNGSLDMYLSKESSRSLTWRERKKVAIGLARGLKYLHENSIIHGNVKPSNILLTHEFSPLIGDFGFGKKIDFKKFNKDKSVNSDYIAPEHQERGKLSTKADVYSFGVVLLELITGRRVKGHSADKGLVGWAKPLLKGKQYTQLVDPTLSKSYEEEKLQWLVQVTDQCLKKSPKDRMSMNMVVSALQDLEDSEQHCIIDELTPGATENNQPSQKPEQTESRSYIEKGRLKLIVENNNFYKTSQENSDHLNQVEEQMQSKSVAEERSHQKMINYEHMMDQTVVDQLNQYDKQVNSNLYGQTIADQPRNDQEQQWCSSEIQIGSNSNSHGTAINQSYQTKVDRPNQNKIQSQSCSSENLFAGYQSEAILENLKSSKCSICKSKRPNISWQRDFTYDELLEATEGFSIKNSLSESKEGPTFNGLLESKIKIVVKKYQITKPQEEKIFKSEADLLSKARHKNVVMLLGICAAKNQLMIVYEQACNGSLDKYLSRGNFQSLTWRERIKVVVGTARGLKHLHANNIVHGSIKSSNILLTHDFEPLIGDFGFPKVRLETKKSYKGKEASNSGYAAPEYTDSGKVSTKADVYSFGVVLLELISGRSAADKLPGGKSLVGWARPLLGGKKHPQLVDPNISNFYEEEELKWLVQVTEQCLRKNPKDRSSMNMVVSALQDLAGAVTDTDECCFTEYSSSDMPYLAYGQIKADSMIQTQEQIQIKPWVEERDLKLEIKTHEVIGQSKVEHPRKDAQKMQSNPHGDEIPRMVVYPNDKTQEEEDIIRSFDVGMMCKIEVDRQQKVKQMQDLSIENQGETILESSETSLCSICKSRSINNTWKKDFIYEELEAATDGFSTKNSLCEGGCGPAFRGQLDELKIVVKQYHMTENVLSEVELLRNARHENLIRIFGSCIQESQLLIVYEHACNGSLDQHLSRTSGRSLTWTERMKVAKGVAKGLKYLHDNNIIHGRIKPSNILLDHEFNPLLAESVFGKGRCELKYNCKDEKRGNCGYIAPEYQETGNLTDKTDVYSFGVILLELITGCMITEAASEQKCLVEWAIPLLRGRKYVLLLDSNISSQFDEQELDLLVQVIEKCLRKNPEERFTMNMVVSVLQHDAVVTSESCVAKESSLSEKSCFFLCNATSDATSSKAKKELPPEEGLYNKVVEERVDNITCNGSDGKTKAREEKKMMKIQKKESLSTKLHECNEWCLFYGGARHFYLQGAKEYTVCQEFFIFSNQLI